MKRTGIVFLAVAAMVLAAGSALAEDSGSMPESPFYVSGGASYNFENFDFENAQMEPDYDAAWGLSLAAGMHVTPFLALEADFDWLSTFDNEETFLLPGGLATEKDEVDLTTYMGVLKVSPFGDMGMINLYGLGGVGWMQGDAEQVVTGALATSVTQEEGDWCAKAGGGVDFFTKSIVGFGVEAAYVWGFGDLDTIRYTQAIAKVMVNF